MQVTRCDNLPIAH